MEEQELDRIAKLATSVREEEDAFARDDDDILIRREAATREQFEEKVSLTIDGQSVTVPKAKPLTDATGNPIRDRNGEIIPRSTTIYDAALALAIDGYWSKDELDARIPILCHQEHLNPIGVCRVCSVHLQKIKRNKLEPMGKLAPACQRLVEDKMVVTTRVGPKDPDDSTTKYIEQIHNATSFLAELLAADHLAPSDSPEGTMPRFRNELRRFCELVKSPPPRFHRNPGVEDEKSTGRNFERYPKSRSIENGNDVELPYSSQSIRVDHDLCIVCDRCVRGCTDVRGFKIIGHTGKGYKTRISFDLDLTMHASHCVQCGECMISCPTGALQLNRRVGPSESWPEQPMIPKNPDRKLEGIPHKRPSATSEEVIPLSAEKMRELGLIPEGESH